MEIKCLAEPHILSFFLNSFNKFNNTGAQMLDSVYHLPAATNIIL